MTVNVSAQVLSCRAFSPERSALHVMPGLDRTFPLSVHVERACPLCHVERSAASRDIRPWTLPTLSPLDPADPPLNPDIPCPGGPPRGAGPKRYAPLARAAGSLSRTPSAHRADLSVKTADLRTGAVKLSISSVYQAILRTGIPKTKCFRSRLNVKSRLIVYPYYHGLCDFWLQLAQVILILLFWHSAGGAALGLSCVAC